MRTFFTCMLLFNGFVLSTIAAQSLNLSQYNQQRLQKEKKAMMVLGSWAVGNIAVGAVMQGRTSGVDKQFHVMNMGWNGVNLILAGTGLYSAMTADPTSFDLYQTVDAQHHIQKVLLFNAGLDVGYMATGWYLMERSRRPELDLKRSQQFKGWGRSLVLQGAFLFAFDIGTNLFMGQGNKQLQPLLQGLSIGGNSIGWNGAF